MVSDGEKWLYCPVLVHFQRSNVKGQYGLRARQYLLPWEINVRETRRSPSLRTMIRSSSIPPWFSPRVLIGWTTESWSLAICSYVFDLLLKLIQLGLLLINVATCVIDKLFMLLLVSAISCANLLFDLQNYKLNNCILTPITNSLFLEFKIQRTENIFQLVAL